MNCINTGCTIYNGCKIKEVAQHCVIHNKLTLDDKGSFNEKGQMNHNAGLLKPDEKVDSYDDNQKK